MLSYFYTDFGFFILRFAVGIVFISHSLPKIRKQIPFGKKYSWLNFLIGLTELVGGLIILSGLWIRGGAIILSILMMGAMYFHILVWKDKFRDGWVLPFLLFSALILLVLTGGGNWRMVI